MQKTRQFFRINGFFLMWRSDKAFNSIERFSATNPNGFNAHNAKNPSILSN